MRLREGIQAYIEVKQSEGTPWTKGIQNLHALFRQIGDLPIDQIPASEIEAFLDGAPSSAGTWYNKYCVLRQFFHYWAVRNEISYIPLPPPRRTPKKNFVPYIYARHELRRLIAAIEPTLREPNFAIDALTFRTLLLFLYGTGAGLSEAVRLEHCDVDFRRSQIVLRSSLSRMSREIPIGSDLYHILLKYSGNHYRRVMTAPYFFLAKNGLQIKASTATKTFQKVRQKANVARHDGATYQPRIQDLRNTFAVHRLTSWLKRGADMGRMIPALSVYMGLHDLGVAERYLQFTAERFRVQIKKLSPKRGKMRRWRDDIALMNFLDSL